MFESYKQCYERLHNSTKQSSSQNGILTLINSNNSGKQSRARKVELLNTPFGDPRKNQKKGQREVVLFIK